MSEDIVHLSLPELMRECADEVQSEVTAESLIKGAAIIEELITAAEWAERRCFYTRKNKLRKALDKLK